VREQEGSRLMGLLESANFLFKRMRVFSNWYALELMYAGVSKIGTTQLRTWRGIKIQPRNLTDLDILTEVFAMHSYDQKPNRIPLNGVIVDVGAHAGIFSLYAATVRKAAKVVSCEPCPQNFDALIKNVELNTLSDVIKPIPNAVAGKKEKRTLYLSESNDSHSLVGEGKSIEVQCVTLKEVLDDNKLNHVDFLKLDCEGAEHEILQNADRTTMDRIDMIGMEFHHYSRQCFESRLKELDYIIHPSKKAWRNRIYIIASKKSLSN
jgi:FkbM family methyltransferase